MDKLNRKNDKYKTTPTWLVVKFQDEDAVAAVPKCWYIRKSEKCCWPPSKYSTTKKKDFVKSSKAPESDWKRYPATILGTYDTLAHAELKAEKARNTSDLSSNNEEYHGTRYNRKTNKKQSPVKVLSDIDSLSDTTSVHSTSDTNEFPSVEGLAPRIATRSPLMPPKRATDTPFTAIKSPDEGTKCITKDTEFTKQIVKEINAIQLKLNDIMENVSLLLKCKRSENELPMRTNDVPDIIHSFPMDEKSLIDVERWLESDTENKKVLKFVQPLLHRCALKILVEGQYSQHLLEEAKELSHIGGLTVKEVTRRIMYRVFTNEVGSQYSWEGAKKKLPFKKLAIASTILAAVRLSKTTFDSNEAEVISHIKAWLVRCTERMKNNTAKLNVDTTGKIIGDSTEVGTNNKPKDRGSEVEERVRDRVEAGKKNEPGNRGSDVDDRSRDRAEVGKKEKSKERGSDHSQHSLSDRSEVRAKDVGNERSSNNTPIKEPTRADKSARNRNETTRVKERIERSLPNSDDEIIEASIEDRSRTRSD